MRSTTGFCLALLLFALLFCVRDAHCEPYLLKRRPLPNPLAASTTTTTTSGLLASPADAKHVERLSKMSSKELKKFIDERKATCHGCIDRQHLLEKALEVRRAPNRDDMVASQLALVQHSVVSQPAPHHFRQQTDVETAALHLLQASLTKRHCQPPLANGTVMCVQYTI